MKRDFNDWWHSFALPNADEPGWSRSIARDAWNAAQPKPFIPEVQGDCSLAEVELEGYLFTIVYEHTLEFENIDSRHPYDEVSVLGMYPPEDFNVMEMFRKSKEMPHLHHYLWEARKAIFERIVGEREDILISRAADRYEEYIDYGY